MHPYHRKRLTYMCNGMSIGHEVFEGSRVDKKTVKEVLKGGIHKDRRGIGWCVHLKDGRTGDECKYKKTNVLISRLFM